MNGKDMSMIGKYMTRILRHHPEEAGIVLDEHGYVHMLDLQNALRRKFKNFDIDRDDVWEIMNHDVKKRFESKIGGSMIRACQGHSLGINLDLPESTPPDVLYHGTSIGSMVLITQQGLGAMTRDFVHLSKDPDHAYKVGKRHGEPIVLSIDAKKMVADGNTIYGGFYCSNNGVWLINFVPKEYITILVKKFENL